MTNSERLRLLIRDLKETQTSFANKVGVAQSTIANAIMRNSNLNSQILGKIIKVYPTVNISWLMTGEGKMFKDADPKESTTRGRLALFVEKEGIDIAEIAISMKDSEENIRKYVTGESTPDYGFIIKLASSYPQLNVLWVLTGNGEMLTNNIQPVKSTLKVDTRPRIPLNAAAGSVSVGLSGVKSDDCEHLPFIPAFSTYNYTILVKGDSMEPEFKSGDELACLQLTNGKAKFIQWGRYHVLDTVQGIVVKRIYDSGDYILCKSENKELYPDFQILKEDIYNIGLVIGMLRRF